MHVHSVEISLNMKKILDKLSNLCIISLITVIVVFQWQFPLGFWEAIDEPNKKTIGVIAIIKYLERNPWCKEAEAEGIIYEEMETVMIEVRCLKTNI